MDYQLVISEIRNKLTGNKAEDYSYLLEECQRYKDHKELLREIGRMIYGLLNDQQKDEINSLIDNKRNRIMDELNCINELIGRKRIDEAINVLSKIVNEIETMFIDDEINEYHSFDESMEEMLYLNINKPSKKVRATPFPYSYIYYLYGTLLIENGEIDKAREVLLKARKYNPVSAAIAFELSETYKINGDYDEYLKLIREILGFAYRQKDIGRCYRAIAYYLIEKQKYDDAVCALFVSMEFDHNEVTYSELQYIEEVSGKKIVAPSTDTIKALFTKCDIQFGANRDVVNFAVRTGLDYYQNGNNEAACYYLSIAYELTESNSIKQLLENMKS